jgi:hypothetical protein
MAVLARRIAEHCLQTLPGGEPQNAHLRQQLQRFRKEEQEGPVILAQSRIQLNPTSERLTP